MAVRKINSSDTLENGFRAKYNETVDRIPINFVFDEATGLLSIVAFDNAKLEVNLYDYFYNQDEIDQKLIDAGIVIPNASEDQRGIIRIATLAEVDGGNEDLTAITPWKAKRSTIFPFKGVWVAPAPGEGYRENDIVVRSANIYRNESNGNEADPVSPSSGWEKLSNSGSVSKTPITKSGADVSDDSLDLSGETLPTSPIWCMYINGVTPPGAPLYNKSTKSFTNLPSVDPGDVIEIYFL